MELSKEGLVNWLATVLAWPDLEHNGGQARLGRVFLWGSKASHKLKGAETLWEHKLLRPDLDDWPSAEALAEEAWGVLEERDAVQWRVVKGRATLIGGGEAPSKKWSGPGLEVSEEEAEEEAEALEERRRSLTPAVQRVQRTGEMGDVLGAVGELVSSFQDVMKAAAELVKIQNGALVNRERLILGQFGLIGQVTAQSGELRGEALEAQAELLAATRETTLLQQQLAQEGELSATLAKAAGAGANVLVGKISDSAGMRSRVLSGLASASDEELAQLASSPEAQRLLARLIPKTDQK